MGESGHVVNDYIAGAFGGKYKAQNNSENMIGKLRLYVLALKMA